MKSKKVLFRRFIATLMLLLAYNMVSLAQIVGTVKGPSGEPLVGVSVIQKGTTKGVVTDVDGNFNINVEQGVVLKFSSIGYADVEQASVNSMTVTMTEDAQTIDDVVVVGYGKQSKVNLSGAVVAVDVAKMLDSRPVTNVSTALAGMASGVYVTNTNNRPSNNNSANITIRGEGTLNNSSPLVIIDGVESSLNSINPTDIETVSVLKDASSSAIYGSRAANGVILVTTKKGKVGQSHFSYNGYVSFESMRKNYNVVSNYADYMGLMNEGYSNSGKTPLFSQPTIDLWRSNEDNPKSWLYPNNNIMDFYQTGVSHQHNFTANGGSEKITYYTSVGYLNNPGVLPANTGYERFNLRTNLESKVTKWLTIGTNLSGYVASTPAATDNIDDSYTYALTGGNPGVAWKDDQGRLGINANPQDDQQNAANNPFLRLLQTAGDIKYYNAKVRAYAILNPIKGLTIQGSYNFEFNDKVKKSKPNFVPLWNFQTETLHSDGVGKTSIYNYDSKDIRNFMDGVISYENTLWEKFNFGLMIGASQEKYVTETFSATKQDLVDPSLWVIDAATGMASASGNSTAWAMHSYFGRLNLNWEEKYFIEANLRADGSSRFAPKNRWGYFPSVSAAWRISQENFMENITWLNNLKIRGSYGSVGNNTILNSSNAITNYPSQSIYSLNNYVLGSINKAVSDGLVIRDLSNSNVSWETTYIGNGAIDFMVLNNRLSGTIEGFSKKTDGILIALPAPGVHGTSTIPAQNAAVVTNNGFEVTLNWTDKIGKDFRYSIGGNLTYITNKVNKFRGNVKSITGWTMLLEGQPKGINYVRKVSGIVETQEQLDRIQKMIDDAPTIDGVKQKPFPYGTPQLGDLMYEDINEDGIVNDDDRYMVGTGSTPPLTYGINISASWKGIDLSMILQGMYGLQDTYLSALYQPGIRAGYQINSNIADGRWYDGRTTAAQYPRLLDESNARNQKESDFWLMPRNFLKIRNIQLGYTLPKPWLDVIKMKKIRAYVSLENFFTFTKWKGFDPEFSGITYPSMREIVIGLDVTF